MEWETGEAMPMRGKESVLCRERETGEGESLERETGEGESLERGTCAMGLMVGASPGCMPGIGLFLPLGNLPLRFLP
jgi:hypothetical protein